MPPDCLDLVNTPMTEAEVAATRLTVRRDRPYGTDAQATKIVGVLALEYTL
jgi:hypothetical protein